MSARTWWAGAVTALLVFGTVIAPPAAPGAVAAASQVQRTAGTDRYDTSARISAATFSAGVDVVFIASGEEFPDALSASSAAGARGGPVLLTTPTALPSKIASELRRLQPREIVILGGEVAIAPAVETALTTLATGTVRRVSGEDRYETSAMLSAETFRSGQPVVYLASGTEFPDALSAAARAGAQDAPVLLTAPNTLPAVIRDELVRLKPAKIVLLGGTVAVGEGVSTAVRAATGVTPERLAGAHRYATSASVSSGGYAAGARVVYIASGTEFPDALSGAAAAAHRGAPLLLTAPDVLPGHIARELARLRPASIVVLGGDVAVTSAVVQLLEDFGAGHAAATNGRLTTTTQVAAGSCLTSSAAGHRLCVTSAGSVEVRDSVGTVTWASGSRSSRPFALRIREDGNLVLFSLFGEVIWQASTVSSGATRLTVGSDGDVQLTTSSGGIRWATMTGANSPTWQLPYEAGQSWAAGAPHSSYGNNAATRGALDFGPRSSGSKRVVTVADGTVGVYSCGGGRSYLRVDHGGGWQSTYYHLVNEQRQLVGQTVPAGTCIGDVGQALPCGGGSTFAHVHLTIRHNGTPVSVEGMTFGGYTIRSAGRDFHGTWFDGAGKAVLTPRGGATCCLAATEAK